MKTIIHHLQADINVVKNNLAFFQEEQQIYSKYPEEMFNLNEFNFVYYDENSESNIFKEKYIIEYLSKFEEVIYVKDNIVLNANEISIDQPFMIKEEKQKEYLAGKICLDNIMNDLKKDLDFESTQAHSMNFMYCKKEDLLNFLNIINEIENKQQEIKTFSHKLFSSHNKMIDSIKNFTFDILMPQIICNRNDTKFAFETTEEKIYNKKINLIQKDFRLYKKTNNTKVLKREDKDSALIDSFLNKKLDKEKHTKLSSLYDIYQIEADKISKLGGCTSCKEKALKMKYKTILNALGIT